MHSWQKFQEIGIFKIFSSGTQLLRWKVLVPIPVIWKFKNSVLSGFRSPILNGILGSKIDFFQDVFSLCTNILRIKTKLIVFFNPIFLKFLILKYFYLISYGFGSGYLKIEESRSVSNILEIVEFQNRISSVRGAFEPP